MTSKNRTCKLCNEFKDISHFAPQGYQCRECRNEKQRAYWAALPEDVRIARQKVNIKKLILNVSKNYPEKLT